jgi:plastocyanin
VYQCRQRIGAARIPLPRNRAFSLSVAGLLLLVLGSARPAVAEVAGTAEIRGVIHITKRLTKRPVAPVATAYHRGVTVQPPGAEEDFVKAELGRVAIYLESDQALPSATVPAKLEQKDRRFVEDTVVIPVGSSVSFPNLDPIFHNVFSLSRAKSFDLGNYPQNETRSVTFPKPGIVRVYCHLHPNMSASIVVAPNRWAVTPEVDGNYRLRDVPVGEHTVVVWHKSAGFFRERVKLAAGQTVEVDFMIPVGAGPVGADPVASGALSQEP